MTLVRQRVSPKVRSMKFGCRVRWWCSAGDPGGLAWSARTIVAMSVLLAYVAAAVVAAWGVAHAVPTRQVVAGFGQISADNSRVIRQEWLAEAFTMWGTAAMVIAATAAGGADDARVWVYRAAAALLVALGTLTALTGARTPVVWFKICPVLLAGSAGLLLAASWL